MCGMVETLISLVKIMGLSVVGIGLIGCMIGVVIVIIMLLDFIVFDLLGIMKRKGK